MLLDAIPWAERDIGHYTDAQNSKAKELMVFIQESKLNKSLLMVV